MKKLKELRNKLRVWIIHKLGGYAPSDVFQPKIEYHNYNPVVFTAKYRLPRGYPYKERLWESGRADTEQFVKIELYSRINAELCRKFDDLVEIRCEENFMLDSMDYTAFLRVLVK